jgi:hypothetical protein
LATLKVLASGGGGLPPRHCPAKIAKLNRRVELSFIFTYMIILFKFNFLALDYATVFL